MCGLMYLSAIQQRSEEGAGDLRAGIPGGCEAANMGAGN